MTKTRRAPRRLGETITHPRQPGGVERDRRVVRLIVRNRRWRHCLPSVVFMRPDVSAALPRQLRRGFATSVRQLDRDGNVGPASHTFERARYGFFSRVGPETNIAVTDASFRN